MIIANNPGFIRFSETMRIISHAYWKFFHSKLVCVVYNFRFPFYIVLVYIGGRHSSSVIGENLNFRLSPGDSLIQGWKGNISPIFIQSLTKGNKSPAKAHQQRKKCMLNPVFFSTGFQSSCRKPLRSAPCKDKSIAPFLF